MNGWSSGFELAPGKGGDRLDGVAGALEHLTAIADAATGPVVRRR